MGVFKRALYSDKKYYFLPLGFILPVFFLIPFELYYTAQIYWDWKKNIPLSIAVTGILLYVVLVTLFFIFDKIGLKKIISGVAFSLSFFGVLILFSDIFAPLVTNLASGAELKSTEPIIYTIIEIGLLCFLIALTVKLKVEKTSRVFCILILFLSVVSAGYIFLVTLSKKPVIKTLAPKTQQSVSTDLKGNVYHILLDEMQTDAALIYLNEKNNREDYRGFTLFKNNLSNYLYTHVSFPSYITGRLYEKDSLETWYKESYQERGLFKALHKKGYNVRTYVYSDSWYSPYIDEYYSLNTIYEMHTGIKNREYQDFIQILSARVMPNFLANESLEEGKKIGKTIFSIFSNTENLANQNIPVSYDEGKEPYSSVQAFKHMIHNEKNRPANGQYTYLHAVLPHPPFVYDENGRYGLENRTNDLDGYMRQVRYAFKLVGEFINELKRLSRYDDATIIIHSDTGRGAYGFLKKQGDRVYGTLVGSNSKSNPDAKLIREYLGDEDGIPDRLAMSFKDHLTGRIKSLFMIKTKHNNDVLTISETSTQLIDLYPTIADVLQLDAIKNEDTHGVSVFDSHFPEDRDAFWYWFPQRAVEPDVLEIRVTNPEDLENTGFEFTRIVNRELTRPFPDAGIQIDIGSRSEAPLQVSGFGSKSKSGNSHYRWVDGESAKLTIKSRHFKEDTYASLTLRMMPYIVNENTPMIVSTELSKQSVLLKKGMQTYSLTLKFPKDKDPVVQLAFENAKSPKALGLGEDVRKLAALFDTFSLIKQEIEPFPDDGIRIDVGSKFEAPVRFSGFGHGVDSDNSRYRWIVEKNAEIIVKNHRFKKDTFASVTLRMLPYTVNENTPLIISTQLSKETVLLKKGAGTYSVVLQFPKDKDPVIHLEFNDAKSPKSIGRGEDVRTLAALVNKFSLIKVDR